MFTEKDLENFAGVLRTEANFIEIKCYCRFRRYGDSSGKLRVFTDGKLEIDCCCLPGCPKLNLSPIEFAKHVGKKPTMDNWNKHLHVMNTEGKRVSLAKAGLLRYHTQTFHRPLRGPNMHRDEFIRCSKCKKERRFSLQTKEQCRIFHDASLRQDWQCSDMLAKITCNDDKERRGRKSSKGCLENFRCNGCIRCICIGCNMCRFEDCECHICTEYYAK